MPGTMWETLFPPPPVLPDSTASTSASDPVVPASVCDRCGEEVEPDSLRDTVSGDEICGSCADYLYVTCADCSLLDLSHETRRHQSGEIVCSTCTMDYNSCSNCGDLISRDSFSDYCDDCQPDYESDDEESDEDFCCSQCSGQRINNIRNWDYRPIPDFHGEGPLYLGLELEVETQYNSTRQCATIAIDTLGSLGYLKTDGSLDNGFEIVTHPMSHDYTRTHFPYEVLSLIQESGAYSDRTTGVHVHASRAGFDSPGHIHRWLKLFYRNEKQVCQVARRQSSQWAPFRPSDRQDIKKYAKGDRSAQRYAAINVTNPDTFEVRIFASTLNQRELQAALDLVAASIEYTRTLTVADIVRRGGWEWPSFSAYVSEHEEYAALSSEMSLLCVS